MLLIDSLINGRTSKMYNQFKRIQRADTHRQLGMLN